MLADHHSLTDTSLPVMSASTQVAVPSGGTPRGKDVPQLHQSAEKLRSVAHQVESFLIRQIDRLQAELQLAESVTERYDLEQMRAEFEQMKQKWDAERQSERSRLQEDSQRLAEAWKRLEADQRELLKYRVPNKLANLGTSRPATTRPPSSLSPASATVTGSEASLVCSAAVGVGAAASHKNQLQFQQLRREMMEHARQRRK